VSARTRQAASAALAGFFALALFHALGWEFLAGHVLDVGRHVNHPTPGYGRFLGLWSFFGTLAAGLLAWALVRAAKPGLGAELATAWRETSATKWLVYGTLLAGLVPAALRVWLLGGMPLTDDEGAYRFMAEVLARGRLWADSPPLKIFFDRSMMINDGKLYGQYFIGWSALQVPGVWLGIPGFMNAVYSALTLPALFLTARRLAGPGWARVVVVLYLTSPMLMIGAATELSHTSCLFALVWAGWLALRSRDADAPLWVHAGVALAFSVAFFVRPISAVGLGVPLLAYWALGLRASSPAQRLRALGAFALPALVLAGLFLAVNQAQTGSAFELAYQRAFTYAQENDFRFSFWPEDWQGERFSEFTLESPVRSMAVAAAALFRLNFDLLGWPFSLAFIAFAGLGRGRGLVWATFFSFFLTHAFTNNVGIDTFAPMHYYELAWALLLLTVCGLERLRSGLARLGDTQSRLDLGLLPPALAAALVVTAFLGFLPPRLGAIHGVAESIALPFEAVEEAQLERAVVFAPSPFIQYCKSEPAWGWVFTRPNNDPQLENDVLWVNHVDLEMNRRLMRHFPGREGWMMFWDPSCRVVLVPLDRVLERPPGAAPG